MSKYLNLWKHISNTSKDELLLSFDDIEKTLGFPIDHSFLTYKKELKEYGYKVSKVSLKDKTVLINKVED